MQKIIPHLWFDKESEEAINLYTSVFKNSSVGTKSYYTEVGQEFHKQEPGTLMSVEFTLDGFSMLSINAGPMFKFTPAISFFINCETEEEIDTMYSKLSEGGSVLMELQKYPFSEKYAWIADKFGLTWQLSLSKQPGPKITPSFLFVGEQAGKAEEAINLYTTIFPDSKVNQLSRYGAGMEPNPAEALNYASFNLANQSFVAMDSFMEHKFTFTEAVSLLVNCEDQIEIDKYWDSLSAVPEAEQCGWLKDKYGVSWQIVPKDMGEMMADPDQEKKDRVMAAVMQMKKLNISELEKAAKGE